MGKDRSQGNNNWVRRFWAMVMAFCLISCSLTTNIVANENIDNISVPTYENEPIEVNETEETVAEEDASSADVGSSADEEESSTETCESTTNETVTESDLETATEETTEESVALETTDKVLTIVDGAAQKVFNVSDARKADYTNKGSDIYRFCVYVETDYDTDSDGNRDLVKVFLQVPVTALMGKYDAPVILDPTPYNSGTYKDAVSIVNFEEEEVPDDFNLEDLYKKAAPREYDTEGIVNTYSWANEIDGCSTWYYSVPKENATGYLYMNEYEYFLERGFAVAMASGIGTTGSEGFELCGMDLERDAMACVVEWLAGDENRHAFTCDEENNPIVADWSNGSIAMTGTSYGGTLPFEVATTGVKGLKTIIPFAGIASWYNYTNSQGVQLRDNASYTDYLAMYNSGGCLFKDSYWTEYNIDYLRYLKGISNKEIEARGNYTEIWESMDYTRDCSKINCSALIVQGVNDFNVTTKHADDMYKSFKAANKDVRMVLHQSGHNNLSHFIVAGTYWNEILNRWLCHYLLNEDNDITEDLAPIIYQDNLDQNEWHSASKWRDFDYKEMSYISPDFNDDGTVISASFGKYWNYYGEDRGNVDEFYAELPWEYTTKFIIPFANEENRNTTILGAPRINLKISSTVTERDRMMVSAVLIDVPNDGTEFKIFQNYGTPGTNVKSKYISKWLVGAEGYENEYYYRELVETNSKYKCISYGWIDLDIPVDEADSENMLSYRTGKDREKDKYYSYTINMLPTAYTMRPDHHLELVILPWDPYKVYMEGAEGNLKIDYEPDDYLEIANYSFKVDRGSTVIKLPIAEKSKDIKYSAVTYNDLIINAIADTSEGNGVRYKIDISNDSNGEKRPYTSDMIDDVDVIIDSEFVDITEEDYRTSFINDSVYVDFNEAFIQKLEAYGLLNTEITIGIWDHRTSKYGTHTIIIGDEEAPVIGWGDVIEEDQIGFASPEDIPSEIWVRGIENFDYTGKAITQPDMRVYYGTTRLVDNIDYTVKYLTNINAGTDTAKVIITGKGNFADSITETFTINALDISSKVSVRPISVAYNKNNQKVTPVVNYEGKKLVVNKDYKLVDEAGNAVTAYKEAGTYNVIVQGIGNYTGNTSFKFIITDAVPASKVTIASIKPQKYDDGKEIKPAVKLSYKGKDVTESFDITYRNNVEVGTATVIVAAKEGTDFVGVKTADFKITGTAISGAKLASAIPARMYHGTEYCPELNLIIGTGKTPLILDRDYKVAYSNNVKAGTAKVVITGKGGYTGTKTFTYKITAYDLAIADNKDRIKVNGGYDMAVTYEKGGAKPHPVVTFDGVELTEKTDYTLSYANANAVAEKNATKAPTLTVTLKGNYKGKIAVKYTIVKKNISEVKVTIADKVNNTKKANSWKQTAVTLTDTNGSKLAANTDYIKAIKYYRDAACTEELTDTIVADGTTVYVKIDASNKNYTGSVVGSYRLSKTLISGVSAKIADQTYTGKEIRPIASQITVTKGKDTLKPGVDYIVVPGSYTKNINKGTATLTIQGIGDYCGTKNVTYKIVVKKIAR